MRIKGCLICLLAALSSAYGATPADTEALLKASQAADWVALDPENTLYMELAQGRVVMQLAPQFAPRHVANIKALARERYFDDLYVIRSQDNYVVQWGDPEGSRKPQQALTQLPAEFSRAMSLDLPFTRLADGDVYAPEVGFTLSMPAARDPEQERTWLAHCYGMVGAGRGLASDSGSGTELYVVIGHAPRHLDRNVTLVGRVVAGIELLSTLPRGTGPLGFYESESEYVPIKSIVVAADVPPEQRSDLEVIRTDTPTFSALIEARRWRRNEWFVDPVGHLELCNMPIYVRPLASAAPEQGATTSP